MLAVAQTLLASAARTATNSTPDQQNRGFCGAHIIVNVTAFAATPAVTPTIEGLDPASGRYYAVLTGTTITDVTVGAPPTAFVFKVGPGITPVAGQAAADFLPATWRVTLTHGDADSITYSVGAHLFGET